MSKILNYYVEGDTPVDKTWYNSTNIKYTECIDKKDDLKDLIVVYSTGARYKYKGVNVHDYLVFRESDSTGKALNRLIKGGKYEFEKMDNADLNAIEEELSDRKGGVIFLSNKDKFTIEDSLEHTLYAKETTLNDEDFNMITDILKSLNIIFKIKE